MKEVAFDDSLQSKLGTTVRPQTCASNQTL